MKVKDLIEHLKDYADFDINFVFTDNRNCNIEQPMWADYKWFAHIEIADIGYSEKVIVLTGDER